MNTAPLRRLKIVSGTSHLEFAQKIAQQLGMGLSPVELSHFANGEIRCQIDPYQAGQ
jgi:phosphoribosylpyrophosphate synthetase